MELIVRVMEGETKFWTPWEVGKPCKLFSCQICCKEERLVINELYLTLCFERREALLNMGGSSVG